MNHVKPVAALLLCGYLGAGTTPQAKPRKHSTVAKRPTAKKRVADLPRVLLADHQSSIVLPAGWTRMKSVLEQDTLKGVPLTMAIDAFIYNNDPQATVAICIANAPPNLPPDRLFNAGRTPSMVITPYVLGGLPGVMRRDDASTDDTLIELAANRGQKMYWFYISSGAYTASGSASFVHSFHPR